MGRKSCTYASLDKDIKCAGSIVERNKLSIEDIRTLRLASGCKKHVRHMCQYHLKRFTVEYPSFHKQCCNPYGLISHDSEKKKKGPAKRSLDVITLQLRDKLKKLGYNLIPGKKLCVSCKVKLFKEMRPKKSSKTEGNGENNEPKEEDEETEQMDVKDSSPSIQSSQPPLSGASASPGPPLQNVPNDDLFEVPKSSKDIDELNDWLVKLGHSPISKRKLSRQANYGEEALLKIKTALQEFTDTPIKGDREATYYKEIEEQLKTYISSNSSSSKKLLALTVLPQSMSIPQIENIFKVSNFMARKSKRLASTSGVLSTPGSKQGRPLSQVIVDKVIEFYMRDDNSRVLPGKKETVSVREDGAWVKKRKRLVLSTLGHLHRLYLKENPSKDLHISRSKFCELRPKECILAGKAGSHVVCVCTYHENPKLMFDHANLKSESLPSVQECLNLMVCENATRSCYLRECNFCEDSVALEEALQIHFDSEMVDEVTYNQWDSTDRSNYTTFTKSTEDFIASFVEQVEELVTHDFYYKEQFKYLKNLTTNMAEGEVIVTMDFGENYTFVVQRSAQSYYFRNQQATLHPFVYYYKLNGEVHHGTYLVISDHMDHDTAAVYAFQKALISHLKATLPFEIKKIKYISDGCSGQYKNKKNVANLWYHLRDFGIPAEWHFSATSHGKSVVDGIVGMIKQLVYHHSLRAHLPGDQITTPQMMYEWVKENVSGVVAVFVPTSSVQEAERKLMVS